MNLERATRMGKILQCTVVQIHPENSNSGFIFTDTDGRTIYIREGEYSAEKGKIIVAGEWPTKDNKKITPEIVGEKLKPITISTLKTNEEVAGSIRRRFLKDFKRIFDMCIKYRRELMAWEKTELEMKRRIAEVAGEVLQERDLISENTLSLTHLFQGSFREVRCDRATKMISGNFKGMPLDIFINLIKSLK